MNGDTFTINAGVLVEWDLDLSALTTGLGASTINGTLFFSRTAGSYVLKMSGALTIGSTGTFDASDGAGGEYPAGCTALFWTTLAGAFAINASTTASITLRGRDTPVHKYIHLSQAESAGATTLHVDADITAGADAAYWQANAWGFPTLIRIDNINKAAQSEERTISSVTSSTIVITVGLTNSKLQGAYVILVSRNVKLIGAGATGTTMSTPTNAILNAECRSFNNSYSNPVGCTIGGSISNMGVNGPGGNLAANNIINASITGIGGTGVSGINSTINGIISGCTVNPVVGSGFVISATAVITGNTSGLVNLSPAWIYGTIVNNGVGGYTGNYNTGATSTPNTNSSGGVVFSGASLSNNTADLDTIQQATLYNTLLGSATEFANYNVSTRAVWAYVESFDHDQVAGAYRNWCVGGITNLVAGTVYPGRAHSYQHALELPRTGVYSFRDQHVLVPPGGWLNVLCYLQKDASMSYLPRVQVFDTSKEPLVSGSADSETQMTNSTNTWEVLTPTAVHNTSTVPKLYTVRVIASNASGNVYEDTDIYVSGFANTLGEAA